MSEESMTLNPTERVRQVFDALSSGDNQKGRPAGSSFDAQMR
jgi:hypothetical protein